MITLPGPDLAHIAAPPASSGPSPLRPHPRPRQRAHPRREEPRCHQGLAVALRPAPPAGGPVPGHDRPGREWASARELGWTHLACVVVDESEVEATAFAIADFRRMRQDPDWGFAPSRWN